MCTEPPPCGVRRPSCCCITFRSKVNAAPRIAEAIAAVDADSERLGIEAILVTRGGGSMEDLWCFNDEAVVRAVATANCLWSARWARTG